MQNFLMAEYRMTRPLIHSTELSEHVKMEGQLLANRSLLIKGRFTGSIKSVSHVTIDKGAVVEPCMLAAQSITISGRMSGFIVAEEWTDIRDKASVSADIETAIIGISDTARFEGRMKMPGIGD